MNAPFVVAFARRAAAALARLGPLRRSRRDIGRAVAGLTAGGAWGSLVGIDAADARKKRRKRKKKRCKNGKVKCGKQCIPAGDCCKAADCGSGERCAQGQCVVGQGSCQAGDDVCIDLADTCGGGGQCNCFTTMANETRCGSTGTLSDPDTCLSDDDCRLLAPDVPGAFCSKDTGTNCVNGGICIGPCTFPD